MKKEDSHSKVQDLVILFTDVHNCSIAISGIAEGPFAVLQEMYETLGEIIIEHQGEILKYMGDAMLCVFPAGSEQTVVKAALKLRKAFAAMKSWQKLPGNSELEIGIASGNVNVGIVGHRTLRQKDVFGEEVNRAAMIGHHRGIAITERVYNRVQHDFATRRLPDMNVKWQPEPLKLWEIVEG